jgi:DNA-binding CsgD family transcriptional regulator
MTSDRVRTRRDIVAQLALQGHTPAQIAEETGHTLDVIHGDLGHLRYFGITAPRGHTRTANERDRDQTAAVAKLASAGKTRKEIAEETDISYQQVCYIIRRDGIEVRTRTGRPGNDSLIEENRDIRRMVDAGFSARQIGVALGPERVNATLRLRGLHLQAAEPATILQDLDATSRELTDDGVLALRVARHMLSGRSTTQAAKAIGAPLGDVRAVTKAFGLREALEGARAGRREMSDA